MIIYSGNGNLFRKISSGVQCAWCKKWLINENWIDLPNKEYVDHRQVSHGMCPKCVIKEFEECKRESEELDRKNSIK